MNTESVEAGFTLDLPDFRNRFPLLDRGFASEDADLKVGPVYFKLRALSAGILYSDNVRREEFEPEEDVIGIVRLAGTIMGQITEGLQLSISGNLVWLPFEGEFGVAGFSLIAPYTFGLEGNTGVESQIAWDTMIGGWNVVFANDFRISEGRFILSTRDDFELFEGGDFDESDRAGRYSFRAPLRRHGGLEDTDNDTDLDILYYSNVASVTTERLLPGPVRLRVQAYHENLWYNQGNRGNPELRDEGDNPNRRDGVIAVARSERDNMRFKPFALYRATNTDNYDGFNHETRIGIDGPITEQLKLHLDVGWFNQSESGSNRFLWGMGLHHRASPYLYHSLIFERQYRDLSEELYDNLSYRIHHVFGPKLIADAFTSIGQVTDLGGDALDRDEFRAGIRFTSQLGPRTTFRAGYTYSTIALDDSDALFREEDDDEDDDDDDDNDDDRALDRQTHTVRLELAYRWTDTLQSRLIYQYQQRDSSDEGDSYRENLIFLTISKYFD